MSDNRMDWISTRAYGLWEASGREHGRDQEHWDQAAREWDERERVALPGHVKKGRAPKEVDAATRNAISFSRKGKNGAGKPLPRD